MKTKTIKMAERLSVQGKRNLLKLLAEHVNERNLDILVSAWLADIRFNEHVNGVGTIEIGGFYTATGNPVIAAFDEDDVILHEYEAEDEDA